MATKDPLRAYNFKLDISGITEGHFTECSGLSVKIDSIPYREAGNKQIVRHIPGQVEYAAVTLRYGLTSSRELWDWLQDTVSGETRRKNVSIIMLDSKGDKESIRWNLIDAWPSEWKGADLNASERTLAIESLTLVFDGLERA